MDSSETMVLKRTKKGDKALTGELYMPDGFLQCRTLEDIPREVKVAGETCIPAGKYEVIVGWSNRFKRLMPRLLAVPGFEGILIHCGNDDEDTEGCVLVGKRLEGERIAESRIAFEELFPKIKKMTEKGKLYIDIQNLV